MNGLTEFDTTHQTVYAFARCEQWLRDFSETHGIPCNVLTQRVAALLHSSAGGEVLGLEDNLPPLRTDSSTGSEATPEVEVVKRPHRKTQVKKKKFSCTRCDITFGTDRAYKQHYYQSHVKAQRKSKLARKPKLVAKRKTQPRIACTVCGKPIAVGQMANHVRHTHSNDLPRAVTQTSAERAMAQYREAVASQPQDIQVPANGSTV